MTTRTAKTSPLLLARVAGFTFLFYEVVLSLWLLIKGIAPIPSVATLHADSVPGRRTE